MKFSFNRFAKSQSFPTRRRCGAVFVEFALILPVFVFLLLATIQYGRLIQATETVTNLSRDGARFATLGADKNNAEIIDYLQRNIDQTALDKADFQYTITPTALADRKEGAQVKVELVYNLKSRIFVPPIARFLLGSYKDPSSPSSDPVYLYRSSTIMRIINAY